MKSRAKPQSARRAEDVALPFAMLCPPLAAPCARYPQPIDPPHELQRRPLWPNRRRSANQTASSALFKNSHFLSDPTGPEIPPAPPGGTSISPIAIEDELKRSYLDYAMSVIVQRALPDVRDGLKPVHRRIIFSMHEEGRDWNKPYRKSALIVGDVMGKYHPHGDQSIYDALVRMAQEFSMRAPLIDGQGNFGSVDGDPPAAMRYTESRRSKIAHALTEDIDKDTVAWKDNYDSSEREPIVLPARFPNLLVNGAGGIAVGMATNIPPHNLGEVIDACLAYIDVPSI